MPSVPHGPPPLTVALAWTDAWAQPDALTACEALLSPAERARQARFRRPADRRTYAIAHALLRRSLSRLARDAGADVAPSAWRFRAGPWGKPELAAPEVPALPHVAFNLSHAPGLTACAVQRQDESTAHEPQAPGVGVDVEFVERVADPGALGRRFFAPPEAAWLPADPADPRFPEVRRRFFTLWTLKEAYVKARGLGFHLPLSRFTVGGAGELPLTAPAPGVQLALAGPEDLRVEAPPAVDPAPARWALTLTAVGPRHLLATCAPRAPDGAPPPVRLTTDEP